MGQKGQRFDTHALTHEAQTLTRDVVIGPVPPAHLPSDPQNTHRLHSRLDRQRALLVLLLHPEDVPHHPRQPRSGHQIPHPAGPHPHGAAPRGRNTPPRQLRLPFALLDRHGVDRRRLAALPRHQIRRDGRRRLRPADGRHVAAARRAGPHSSTSNRCRSTNCRHSRRDKEKMSAAIPAIWPIDRSALHNDHIGAFSLRRFHPVLYPRAGPHGRRLGLRPRHAGIRHGRRRGGGGLLGRGTTAATAIRCW